MRIDDSRPVWVQLVDDFRLRVVTGQWAAGTRIPSVRELAAASGVNPNTVQRALAELDRQGLTVTERTAGRFVTADAAVLASARTELATVAADAYVDAVARLGLSRNEALDLARQRWPRTGETQEDQA